MTPFEQVPSAEGRGTIGITPTSFSSMRPKFPPIGGETEREVVSLNGKPVYEFFLPGPMYFHAMLEQSLVEGFRKTADNQSSPEWRSLPIQYEVWKFRRPLIMNCGAWNEMICVMDRLSFLYFKQWLSGLTLVDRGRKLVFISSFEQAAILDPFELDGRKNQVPESVSVLCPICKEWHIKPATYMGVDKMRAPEKIQLEFTKPLPHMLENLEELARTLSV
jgi:hypothetical protein